VLGEFFEGIARNSNAKSQKIVEFDREVDRDVPMAIFSEKYRAGTARCTFPIVQPRTGLLRSHDARSCAAQRKKKRRSSDRRLEIAELCVPISCI
jgi:hypothetical protein